MMLRTLIKTAAAQAITWTKLDAVARTRRAPFVVGYHRVVDSLDRPQSGLPAMEISAAMLERHLDWLSREFRVVSVDDLAAESTRSRTSKPPAIVTFDDGYADVFHHGLPILKRKGIPAAIFVVTDLIGTDRLPMHERLYAVLAAQQSRGDAFAETSHLLRRVTYDELERIVVRLEREARMKTTLDDLRPMTWEMLRVMRDAGMTIGSHSRTHAFLTSETTERIHDETAGSRAMIAAKLGTNISAFAYPGGAFNSGVVRSVAAAGYRYAFTICRHRDRTVPFLTMPRTMLWERACLTPAGHFSAAVMSCHAAGAFGSSSTCGTHH
jgi:peptidoglycan/xylan/chitin deacetylase (PgdA/CDA1 family)